MTADPTEVVAADSRLYADIVLALCEATGSPPALADHIRPSSQLEAELRLDSIELAAFGQSLTERFGPAVRLSDLLASLDFDRLIELTVGEVSEFVAERLAGQPR